MSEELLQMDPNIPELPNDVLSNIAEILVAEHHYGTCASLNTTCRGVHEDTKAILWNVVVIPRTWDRNARDQWWRLLDEASGAQYTEFVLDPKPASMASSLFSKHHQLKSRLKAWLSFQPHAATISIHLSKSYRFNSGDLKSLMRMLDVQYRLNLYSERGIPRDITKLNVTMMPGSSLDPDIGSPLYSPRCVAMSSWIRSIQVEPAGRQLESLDAHSAVLGELVVEVSRLIGPPLRSTTTPMQDRQMAHLTILSHCRTREGAIASANALQTALKANPRLLTIFTRLDFTVGHAETILAFVSSILDILLPEVFRAFSITNDSQYIDITLPGTHVALTCIAPGSVQVQYLTETPVLIETYQLSETGNVVKVRSGTTYPS